MTRLQVPVHPGETLKMTIDTAGRLSKACGTTPDFWMNLQVNFDLGSGAGKIDMSGITSLHAA